jgi:diguanylate cyclase (GGDEF)-like protein
MGSSPKKDTVGTQQPDAALREREAHFSDIVGRMSDGVIVVDKQGNLRYENKAAHGLLESLPESPLFGKDFVWKAKVGKTVELTHAVPEGISRVVEMQITAVEWEKQPAYLGVLRDISEERGRMQALQADLDQAEARTADLEAMNFVANQLNQAAMVEETIQSGLEMIQALTNVITVWALLVDQSGKAQLVVIDNEEKGMKADKGSINLPSNCTCLKKFMAGDLEAPEYIQDCEWMPYIFTDARPPYEHLSIPLRSGGKSLGLLNLVCKPGERLEGHSLELVGSLSHELAQAIERARLFSNNSQALRRSEVLQTASRTISSALDLSAVLQSVMRLASELTGADAGSLGLLSQEEQNLNFPYAAGLPAEVRQPMMRSKNLFWGVIESGKPILMNDYSEPSESLLSAMIPGLRSLLMVPISGRGKSLGVISLYNMSPDKRFSDFDLSLIESLGRQAGLAIQNAELFFEVQQLTTTDTLTGLNNATSFTSLAMREVERAWRYGRPLSIILVDIDNLRMVNDTYGQAAGDLALQSLARNSLQSLRRVDVLGRYENAEILLLLPETDLFRAYDVAERLRQRIAESVIETAQGGFSFTVSMGISGIETKGEIDLQTLLERAESALFDAKNGGRNRVCVWKE